MCVYVEYIHVLVYVNMCVYVCVYINKYYVCMC